MTAMGQNNAIAVLAAGEKVILKADMYMEKLVCGPGAKGVIDLNKGLKKFVMSLARYTSRLKALW